MRQTAVTVTATPQVKQMWMAWMRTSHPKIYSAALQATLSPIFDMGAASLAGLGGLSGNAMIDLRNATNPLRKILGMGHMESYASPHNRYWRRILTHSLAGLGQDTTDYLTSDMSSLLTDSGGGTVGDPNALDISAPSVNFGVDTSASAAPAASAYGSSVWNSLFSTLVATTAGIATTALTGNSAALVQENAQRVAQGLPPLNPNGTVMSVAQMQAAGYTSAQIQTIENVLAGGGSLSTTTLLLIGGAILAVVMLSKR